MEVHVGRMKKFQGRASPQATNDVATAINFFFRTPTIDSQPGPAVLHRLHSFLNNQWQKLIARRIDLPCFFKIGR